MKQKLSLLLILIIPILIIILFVKNSTSDAKIVRIALIELNSHLEKNHSYAKYLGLVDFSKPSWKKRFTIININTVEEESYLVAHAIKSGDIYADDFSNIPGSNKSSLGLFRVGEIYTGNYGKSLRLHGLNESTNSNAYSRAIVLHGAECVNYKSIIRNALAGNGPMLCRSLGCFSVSTKERNEIVDQLSDKGFIYVFYRK